jgi:hypothetical protein
MKTITEESNPASIKAWIHPPRSFAERYPLLSAPDRLCDRCGRRLDVLVTDHNCVGSGQPAATPGTKV